MIGYNVANSGISREVPKLATGGIVLFSLLVACTYGLGYGDGSNHSVYLVDGLRRVQPHLLEHDWWATNTFHYHECFSWLVSLGARLGILPWFLVVINVILIASAYLYIYYLFQRIDRRCAIASWLIFIVFLNVVQGAHSVGASDLFSNSLQPSSIGAFALIAAIYYFLAGRYMASGVALAVGGAFHANFLVLGIPFLGGPHFFLGRAGVVARLLRQIGPSLVLLIYNLPTYMSATGGADAGTAHSIFMDIAVPFHYRPDPLYLIPLAAWIAMGFGVLPLFSEDRALRRRMGWILATFTALLGVASVATMVIFIPQVAQLFFWRMAPFAIVLAQIVLASVLARVLLGQVRVYEHVERWGVALAVAGLLVLLRFFFYLYHITEFRLMTLLLLVTLVAVVVGWRRWQEDGVHVQHVERWLVVSLVALVGWSLPQTMQAKQFNLVLGDTRPAETALFEWARTTSEEAIFLVPPRLRGFRLWAERGVVVDWKAVPVRPAEILEWYRRICRISGDQPVRSVTEAEEDYDNLTTDQLASLVKEFGAVYAVYYRPHEEKIPTGPPIYLNDKYIVFSLEGL